MSDLNVILPSKPRIVLEEGTNVLKGVYEIDGLYPGYGYTLGNSLRRIILSSLPGSAITSVKIAGVPHEFSVLDGVKEDVITILLHLKKIRFNMATEEPQKVTLSVKGPKVVTAGMIKAPGQIEVLNPDLYITEITGKGLNFDIEMTVERGMGFVSKENHQKGKVEIGTIALDAIFTPIRRVSYEVENMRVGDKTNHNRLRITIETDGTITPRESLERSIATMISQLNAILDIKPAPEKEILPADNEEEAPKIDEGGTEDQTEVLKTRIDNLELSTRTLNALNAANIRTIGGIAKKKKEDLLKIEGIGEKGINKIKRILSNFGITLK